MTHFSRRPFLILVAILALIGLAPAGSSQTLENALRPLVNGDLATRAKSSIKIIDLETGRVVAAHTPDNSIVPASNMKLFTTATAMEKLGRNFQFATTLWTRGEVRNGVLEGDLRIVGSGDPTLGTRFNDDDGGRLFDEVVIMLKRAGIDAIDGNLIVEYGYFDSEWVHPSWPKDQLVYWYEAPISSPAIQEGTVIVRVHPTSPGARARVELEPPNDYVTIENTCVTTRRGRGAFVGRKQGTNTIIVKGNAHPGYGPTSIPVPVMYPVQYFGNVMETALRARNISISGQTILARTVEDAGWTKIGQFDTPLAVALFVINKQSQNHYAEQLLKTIGAEKGTEGSWGEGSRIVTDWMVNELGVAANQFHQSDGSGMSADNRASATAFVTLLQHMWNSPARAEFLASMPYSGEQSTRMRRRMNRAPYRGAVFAKTGYLEGAIGLSGYVQGGSGRVYAFSMLFNDYRTAAGHVYNLQNQILETIVDRG
ncbi:MAG: D-alanyl-D-alanine carboxypeptidase/D-alanyl-D-alanine-endopeptidase [Acidobacteria bacterium]|nr:D-alanyl-D-alanine carboxypeptidase/D-alanyl-D-alanine-endopeptidase [Acidobacteriota bacterium]